MGVTVGVGGGVGVGVTVGVGGGVGVGVTVGVGDGVGVAVDVGVGVGVTVGGRTMVIDTDLLATVKSPSGVETSMPTETAPLPASQA